MDKLERFRAKWIPVRVKKTRQNKNLEPRSDSIGTEKALELSTRCGCLYQVLQDRRQLVRRRLVFELQGKCGKTRWCSLSLPEMPHAMNQKQAIWIKDPL